MHFARRRFRSRWASFALVDATLAAVEQALEETLFSHVCLLSGDSYPLVPITTLQAFFELAGERSFMFHADGSQRQRPDRTANEIWYWDGDLRRVTYRHYQLGDRQLHLPNRLLPSVPRLAPPADMQLLQGSQWWTLSRRAAREVIEAFVRRPELRRYFRRVQAPDEWAFQMVLGNSKLRQTIVNEDLFFINWQQWHAATLTPADISRISKAPKLFARKLDLANPAMADAIDNLITERTADDGEMLARLTAHLAID